MKRGLGAAALLLGFAFVSCQNPMVNYLLGDQEPEDAKRIGLEPIPPVEVARWNQTWYFSLADAVAAADDGVSSSSPSVIEIRLDIRRESVFGAESGIVVPAGKYISLKPYTQETPQVLIERWDEYDPLFIIENGGFLALDGAVTLSGANIPADSPLVKIEGGGVFRMESGSLVKDGETFSGKAGGVHAAVNGALKGSLQMRGSAVIQNTDVYLETETQIDLAGILSARPIARITPAVYPDPLDPLTDVWVLAGPTIGGNCSRFDVTPENVPGWSGPRHWRINSAGKLESIIAMHYDVGNSEMKYYSDLQLAFSIALGSPEQYDEVILLANIERDAAAPPLDIALSKYIRLTVPENTSYTIRRAAAASGTQTALDSMFRVNVYAGFELAVPSGAELIIDGGAVWEDGSGSPLGPARGGINVGKASTVIKTNAPLIRVIGGGGGNGTFKMGPGIIIRNNDNTTNGGAILMEGNFEMNGGSITMNRSAGEGGGIYFSTSNFFESILQNGVTVSRYGTTRTILGGSITNNDAGLCGGGIMLSPYGHVRLTMKGGSITGNRAGGPLSLVTFNGRGGGIYIPSNNAVNTAFTMEGGSISGNSAAGFGDNVAIDRKWFPAPVFTLSGSPHIEDIYLDYNVNPAYPEYITVPAAINAAPIHVKLTAPIPQNNSSRRIFAGSGFDPAQFSADAPYVITADGRIRHP